MSEKRIAPGLLLYINTMEPFVALLDDSQLGAVVRALYEYQVDGLVKAFDEKTTSVAFKALKKNVDEGIQRYEKKCEDAEYGVYTRQQDKEHLPKMTREEWNAQRQANAGLDVRDISPNRAALNAEVRKYG